MASNPAYTSSGYAMPATSAQLHDVRAVHVTVTRPTERTRVIRISRGGTTVEIETSATDYAALARTIWEGLA